MTVGDSKITWPGSPGATVITSDPDDIKHLLSTLGIRVPVVKP